MSNFWAWVMHLNWRRWLAFLIDPTLKRQLEKYKEELQSKDIDLLTGLYNANAWFQAKEGAESDPKVHICLFDLSDLKRVNDSYGHLEGDALLERAGQVLSKVATSDRRAFRIGGDEFVLLVPAGDGATMVASVEYLFGSAQYDQVVATLAGGWGDTVGEADKEMYRRKPGLKRYYDGVKEPA